MVFLKIFKPFLPVFPKISPKCENLQFIDQHKKKDNIVLEDFAFIPSRNMPLQWLIKFHIDKNQGITSMILALKNVYRFP